MWQRTHTKFQTMEGNKRHGNRKIRHKCLQQTGETKKEEHGRRRNSSTDERRHRWEREKGNFLRKETKKTEAELRDQRRVFLWTTTRESKSRIRARGGRLPPVHWVAAAPTATPQRSHSTGGAPASIWRTAAASRASPAPTVLTGRRRGGRANNTSCEPALTRRPPSFPRETSTQPRVTLARARAAFKIALSE